MTSSANTPPAPPTAEDTAADRVDEALAAELAEEQSRVDVAYGRLDAVRDAYRTRLTAVRRAGPTGSPQNRSERDAFAAHYESTVARLELVENRLVFGRLDLRDGQRRYVGRIGLQDAERRTILVDWRAPSSRPFYQATAAHPGDVVRRRHLMTRAREVVGVEDELLDAENLGEDLADGLTGEGALFAAMSARRDGRMGDIVATIQAEQDAVVRAPLDGVLVVQGGPGTGKTAVALHRAAYLIYTHRERLERSGVLLVGPSRAFLRYIEQVLPSLGESDVVSTTMADLLPGVRGVPETDRAVARAKGSAAWEKVIHRAVRGLQREPEGDQRLTVDGVEIVLRPGVVRAAIARARRTGAPHNEARETFARAVLDDLVAQYTSARRGPDSADDADERAWLFEDVRSNRDVRVAVNLCWMPTSAATLLERLYARPELLDRHGRGLSDRERRLVGRAKGAPWTEADVPLLDELAELLGPLDGEADARARATARRRAQEVAFAQAAIESQGLGDGMVDAETLADRALGSGPRLTTAERAATDRAWTYGHVVVDEAQELSPMAWRALARRCPSRSFTVVGDLAQHSSRDVPGSWREAVGRLGSTALTESVLTVSYRTPATVLDLAGRVLQANGVRLPHPVRAARDLPGALSVRAVDHAADLPGAVADATRAAVDALVLPGEHAAAAGRVAVLATPARVGALRAALSGAGLGAHLSAGPQDDPLSAMVAVIDPVTAKGLEFDHVVLVEPAELLADGPGDLYVAMTRPTASLTVVHHGDLPAGF